MMISLIDDFYTMIENKEKQQILIFVMFDVYLACLYEKLLKWLINYQHILVIHWSVNKIFILALDSGAP